MTAAVQSKNPMAVPDVRRKTVKEQDAVFLDDWRNGKLPKLPHVAKEALEGTDKFLPEEWLSVRRVSVIEAGRAFKEGTS